MSDLSSATAALVDATGQLVGTKAELLAWAVGTVDGGPNGNGEYPFTAADGTVILVPSAKKLEVLHGDPASAIAQLQSYVDAGNAARALAEAARDQAGPNATAAATAVIAPAQVAIDGKVAQAGASAQAAQGFAANLAYLLATFRSAVRELGLTGAVRFRIGHRLYATWDAVKGFYFLKLMLPASAKVDDVPGLNLTDRLFSAAVGSFFKRLGPELGGAGIRVRIRNRLLFTISLARGFYPTRATLPAATVIDDDFASPIVGRLVAAGLGAYFKRLPAEAGGVIRLRWKNRLLGQWTKAGGWMWMRQTLALGTMIEGQAQPLVNLLGGTFAGRANAAYALVATVDGAGNRLLATRRRTDGQPFQITTAGNAADPQLLHDNRVLWYSTSASTAYVRPADASDIARPAFPSNMITVTGDSTAENGNSGIGNEMRDLFASRPVNMEGIGSQWTRQIAARYGAEPVNATITGGSIPASGSVTVALDLDFLRVNSDNNYIACRIIIAGVAGALVRYGAVDPAAGVLVYTFTRDTAGSAVAVAGAVPITVTSGMIRGTTDPSGAPSMDAMRGGTLIIRTGQNDTGRPDYDQTATVNRIAAMIARQTTLWPQAIVIGNMIQNGLIPTAQGGLFTGTAAQSRVLIQRVLDYNAALQAKFGSMYFDPTVNHRNVAGGTATATVDGLTVEWCTNVVIADGVHESQVGQNNTAAGLQARITQMGFN
jgi:hypothetical protein